MKENNVLVVNSSARLSNSVTRRVAEQMIEELQQYNENINVIQRDVSAGLPFLDETWVNANFTPEKQRSDEHRAALRLSNKLVDELKLADIVILAAPIYNFAIPASLKAWVDQVARVGLTFHHTEDGPVGHLINKKAYIVIASGGTQIGSEIDFASGYLRHVLGFIGISDVSIISADQYDESDVEKIASIQTQITGFIEQAIAQ